MNILLSFSYQRKLVWVASILLIVLLLSLYIVQVNLLTGSAFNISSLEGQLKELRESNKSLERIYMETIQLRNLDELASVMGFEKIGYVSYIKVIDTAVAQNLSE
ncbi:MAG TPA: hypothetical protein ENI13_01130 [candidate division CPR3 bacterium]|uniref:Uncharacterized protein n=1 Tax=candidate division CPR3 bacterium TaxID=2268181 RepID=A0A7C1NMF4_UNCC3|nr:hypothetical protein [candidate division CPR3 bacterium]